MKKTLAILLALVLCLSAFAMIACNKCEHNFVDGVCTKCGDKDPNYKPGGPQGGGEDVEVPVADGKVTFYFTLSDASVAIPSYAGIYYAGGLTGWAEDAAYPFTKFGDTNVYYVQIAYDATVTQANEYAITLGYNQSSGLATKDLGVNWSYKSDECAVYEFPSNAEFTVAEGATRINLGVHTFSTEIAEPVRVNVDLAVTFDPALPETAEVYIIGSVNGWNTTDLTKSKATADESGKTYILKVTDVIAGPHEYKILVFLDGIANVFKPLDKDGNEKGIWDWQKPAAVAQAEGDEEGETPTEPTTPAAPKESEIAYVEICGANFSNLLLDIGRTNNRRYDLAGTNSREILDKDGIKVITPVKGIDIDDAAHRDVKVTEVKEGEGEAAKVVEIISAPKYVLGNPTKKLVVEFATELPEDIDVYIDGGMIGTGWNGTLEQMKMTVAEDRKSASLEVQVTPNAYEGMVLLVHKDYPLVTRQGVWDYGVKMAANNLSINLKGFDNGDVKLFDAAQEVPTIAKPEMAENVVLKVKFDKEIPAERHVVVKGTFTEWNNAALEMTQDATDAKLYTVTVPSIVVKEHEFLLVITRDVKKLDGPCYNADGVWKGKNNATVTINKTDKEYNLFGETVLEVPEFTDVEVTLQLTLSEKYTGKVLVVGDLVGTWTPADAIALTANEDGTVWTAKVVIETGTERSYKVCFTTGDFNWDTAMGANAPAYGGGNATVDVTMTSTTVVLFADVTEGVITVPAAQ